LKKANLIAVALLVASGQSALSLGNLESGQSVNLAGTALTATKPTTEGVGLSPNGDAVLGFSGGIEVDVSHLPNPVLDKGTLNLGTGQYEATGSVNYLPFVSLHVTGNLNTGKGNAEMCVKFTTACANKTITTDTAAAVPVIPGQPKPEH
jgi:hypothetical protein